MTKKKRKKNPTGNRSLWVGLGVVVVAGGIGYAVWRNRKNGGKTTDEVDGGDRPTGELPPPSTGGNGNGGNGPSPEPPTPPDVNRSFAALQGGGQVLDLKRRQTLVVTNVPGSARLVSDAPASQLNAYWSLVQDPEQGIVEVRRSDFPVENSFFLTTLVTDVPEGTITLADLWVREDPVA